MTKAELEALFENSEKTYEKLSGKMFLSDHSIPYVTIEEFGDNTVCIKLEDGFYDVWIWRGINLDLLDIDSIIEKYEKQIACEKEEVLQLKSFTEQNNND